MDNLQKEISELKEFIADLKADRAASQEKERRESWTKYASLSIVFIAVLAAVATQSSGKFSSQTLVQLNESTYNQARASDQWGYYQAKSIKQNLYEVNREQWQRGNSAADPAAKTVPEAMNAKIAKYEQEKTEIQNEAKKLEGQRDRSRELAAESSRRGAKLGFSISTFQIAIAMGSICLLTKKKHFWFISLALAALAAAQMVLVLTS
jgi:hypothetical protein